MDFSSLYFASYSRTIYLTLCGAFRCPRGIPNSSCPKLNSHTCFPQDPCVSIWHYFPHNSSTQRSRHPSLLHFPHHPYPINHQILEILLLNIFKSSLSLVHPSPRHSSLFLDSSYSMPIDLIFNPTGLQPFKLTTPRVVFLNLHLISFPTPPQSA